MSRAIESSTISDRINANSRLLYEEAAFSSDYGNDNSLPRLQDRVLPRTTHTPAAVGRGRTFRTSRVDQYRSAFLYRRQLRPRGALHRAISSFFGSHAERAANSASPLAQSRASSVGSQQGSSIHGSVPSLDVVSPGTFLFSGPNLQYAESHNNLATKESSLSESFDKLHLHRRVRTESFTVVDRASEEEGLLEPALGLGVVRSMSDVLLGVNTPIEELADPPFDCTCDEIRPLYQTAARSKNEFYHKTLVNTKSIPQTNPSLGKTTCTQQSCYDHMNAVTLLPPAGMLPTEILHNIYKNLDAKAFNAARRTCRTWMMASLDKRILNVMLTRGGWLCGYRSELSGTSGNEWAISRYLSQQCALTSHWTGNGLDAGPAIVRSTEIDFSDLDDGYVPQKGGPNGGLIFTASICGRYLMVVKGTIIYIYAMKDGLLKPVTSVVCPRRVLSVSMNTSVGRDAVAALLEGRMGMVCELRYGRPSEPPSGDTCVEGDGHPPQANSQPGTLTGDTSDLQYAIDSAEHTSPRVLRTFPYVQAPDPEMFDAIELRSQNQAFSLRGTGNPSTHERNLINHAWNLNLCGPSKMESGSGATLPAQNMPIESGTSTFYRHLCSEDDPPRNVSICPQRHCVAFGCSAGIELHWIDALTGQSLSRWFPLTSPSDHLYFLSPRPGFESAKKLRLISSAAHPSDQPALNRRFSPVPMANSIWTSFGFEARRRQSQGCDHFQAVPLSDGHHVLFIDPSTERLTLGCDAPLGGPAKLLRKVVFHPPGSAKSTRHGKRAGTHVKRVLPRVYTAAADMSSGARIAVSYGEVVMLYSVPSDVLALSRLEQAADGSEVYNSPPFAPEGRDPDHWLNWWDEPSVDASKSAAQNSPWPISLSGIQVGRLNDICELAVQTVPELTIWAFTYTSKCQTWRFGKPAVRTKQCITRQGLVRDSSQLAPEDEEVVQRGGATSGAVRVDGASGVKRVSGALALEKDSWVDGVDVSGCLDAWFEGADVVSRWSKVF